MLCCLRSLLVSGKVASAVGGGNVPHPTVADVVVATVVIVAYGDFTM